MSSLVANGKCLYFMFLSQLYMCPLSYKTGTCSEALLLFPRKVSPQRKRFLSSIHWYCLQHRYCLRTTDVVRKFHSSCMLHALLTMPSFVHGSCRDGRLGLARRPAERRNQSYEQHLHYVVLQYYSQDNGIRSITFPRIARNIGSHQILLIPDSPTRRR